MELTLVEYFLFSERQLPTVYVDMFLLFIYAFWDVQGGLEQFFRKKMISFFEPYITQYAKSTEVLNFILEETSSRIKESDSSIINL